jgi:hypothetical protein
MTRGGRDRGRDCERHDGAREAYQDSLLTRNETHTSNRAYQNVSFI